MSKYTTTDVFDLFHFHVFSEPLFFSSFPACFALLSFPAE